LSDGGAAVWEIPFGEVVWRDRQYGTGGIIHVNLLFSSRYTTDT
jgi:hypothetical protein